MAPPVSPNPESPAGPQSPAAPGYGGPVPPGGWQQPMPQGPGGFAPGPLAGWGSRAGALLLDALILLVPTLVLIAIVVGVALSSEVGGIVVGLVSLLAFFVVTLLYAPVLMAREGEHNGQTFGKQIVGIRVTRDNGEAMDIGWGVLREFVVKGLLFGTVGGFFFSIPTILDFLWPLWDDQNRALHDMVVSTHVVRA
jgi:uncharacterized RDD family membrane protein YckC